jgi:hypothetical protein
MNRVAQVGASRRVAEALCATPEVWRSMEATGADPLLEQELPLADESPFAGLPDDAAGEGGEAMTARESSALPIEWPVDEVKSQVLREGAATAREMAGASARGAAGTSGGPTPPVFSLGGRSRAKDGASGTRPSVAGPDAPVEGVDSAQSVHREAPRAGSTAVKRGSAAAELRHEAGVALNPVSASTTRAKGQPGFAEPAEHAPTPSAHLAGTLQEIGRLATALLAKPESAAPPVAATTSPRGGAGSETAGQSLASAARFALAGPSTTSARTEAAGSPEAPATAQASFAAPSASAPVPGLWAAAGAGSSPDAEWLAELINEVLAEQARRHGVDLS